MVAKLIKETCYLSYDEYRNFCSYICLNPNLIEGYVVEYQKGKDVFKVELIDDSVSTIQDIILASQTRT